MALDQDFRGSCTHLNGKPAGMAIEHILISDGDCAFCSSAVAWLAARSAFNVVFWQTAEIERLRLSMEQVDASVCPRGIDGGSGDAKAAAPGAGAFAKASELHNRFLDAQTDPSERPSGGGRGKSKLGPDERGL